MSYANIVALLAVALSLGACARSNSTEVANCKLAPRLTADSLYTCFDRNQARAGEQFVGKCVQVHGKVQATGTNEAGHCYAVLATRHFVGGVRCYFSSCQQQLQVGQEVSICGSCIGLAFDVVVAECRVLP